MKASSHSKIYKRKPTLRQTKAMEIILANHGSMPISEAMRQAGYSESMARNSQYLTNSPSFKDGLEKAGLSDEMLAQKHFQLLNACIIKQISFKSTKQGKKLMECTDKKIRNVIEDGSEFRVITIIDGQSKGEKTVFYFAPDTHTQMSAIELACRIKGHFSPSKFDLVQYELTSEEKVKLIALNTIAED